MSERGFFDPANLAAGMPGRGQAIISLVGVVGGRGLEPRTSCL